MVFNTKMLKWPENEHFRKTFRFGERRNNVNGKSSQRKGADGERELAEILRENGYPIERGGSFTYGKVPDLMGLPGIHIEVKRVERLNLNEAMRQAIRDSKRFEDGNPAVFHRRNREQWLVTMRLSDWLILYQEGGKGNAC